MANCRGGSRGSSFRYHRGVSVTLRPRLFLFYLAVCLVGAVVMGVMGAGLATLAPLAFAAIVGIFCRQMLRLDDAGVRYRGLFPKEDFRLAWSEVSQVVVDVVSDASPGNPGGRKARARFLRPDAPGLAAMLFAARDAEAVVEVCQARGVDVVDDRQR